MPPRGRPPKVLQQNQGLRQTAAPGSNSVTPVQSQQHTPVFQTPIPLPQLPQQVQQQQQNQQQQQQFQQLPQQTQQQHQPQQSHQQGQHQFQQQTHNQNGNGFTHTFPAVQSVSTTPNMTPQVQSQALIPPNQNLHQDQNQNNNEPIFVPAPGSAPVPVAQEGEFVAVFSSWEVLYHHVSNIAQQQGYKVVKRRSSAYRDGQAGRYDLTCDRGGSEYKNTAVLRRAHTKKTSCPWKARATRMMTLGGQWKFIVSNGHHNHPPRDPNAPPARYRKKPPQPMPELATGIMELGQTLRADDEAAQSFMTQLESAQDKEREKNGQSIADSLQRISVSIAKLDQFEAALARIEAFGQRLYAIEMRLSQLDRLPPGHGQDAAAQQWHPNPI